ncbi:MAG: hypothetical protein K2N14_03420, partial [Clostridia bacterium]|nr:hypothetical protein [Clostridia bacterium]
MKSILKKALIGVVTCGMVLSFCGCNKATVYDNEEDPLRFATLECDKVFNPFFYTSATDGNIVGMTQLGMLGNDKDGNYTYGDNEAVIVKDLEIKTQGTPKVDQTTTYSFVLKNNIKFSNGSPLTIKDVLFNMYVYLDPVYSGSSTMYSTDIVGLKEYRTQSDSESEQDAFMERFKGEAQTRIDALIDATTDILDIEPSINEADMRDMLKSDYATQNAYPHVVEDFDKAIELFKKELETDYSNSLNAYEDTTFADQNGKVYKPFTTDVEVFLYNEGYISWNKKEGKLYSSIENDPAKLKNYTKDQAIKTVYDDKVPASVPEIVEYWNTAIELNNYLTNLALEEYYKTQDRTYTNISGIKFANRTSAVKVNNVDYGAPTYNDDGSVKDGYEVLTITINHVDPKAIWNFAFGVAPMYYYSDAEHIAKFDFEANFGVEYGSQTFMNEVVKAPEKVGGPVGAGAYAASKSSGGIENITGDQFYDLGMIYFERNPYFLMGPAKIKKVRFKVVSNAQMLNSLYTSEVDFAEPNAKPETVSELNGKKKSGIGNETVNTAGYGYIGINAGKVPDIKVRQAIMHSINTQECVNYYGDLASAIYRSMSKENWAYPTNSTPYYPFIGGAVPSDLSVVNPDYRTFVTKKGKKAGDILTEAEQQEFIKGLVEGAGYSLNADGVYVKGANQLKYTFTIAGNETDHPAYNAMVHSMEILNKCGFLINVTTDSQALSKLSSGALTVWAAAWSSSIDPDMYQVYHK